MCEISLLFSTSYSLSAHTQFIFEQPSPSDIYKYPRDRMQTLKSGILTENHKQNVCMCPVCTSCYTQFAVIFCNILVLVARQDYSYLHNMLLITIPKTYPSFTYELSSVWIRMEIIPLNANSNAKWKSIRQSQQGPHSSRNEPETLKIKKNFSN